MLEKLKEILAETVHVDDKALVKKVLVEVVIPYIEKKASETVNKLDDSAVAALKALAEKL